MSCKLKKIQPRREAKFFIFYPFESHMIAKVVMWPSLFKDLIMLHTKNKNQKATFNYACKITGKPKRRLIKAKLIRLFYTLSLAGGITNALNL